MTFMAFDYYAVYAGKEKKKKKARKEKGKRRIHDRYHLSQRMQLGIRIFKSALSFTNVSAVSTNVSAVFYNVSSVFGYVGNFSFVFLENSSVLDLFSCL